MRGRSLSPPGELASSRRGRFRPAARQGDFYGAARSEAGIAHGLDVHLIGAGNSAGQAAMFFANHARTVTLIVRADALEKACRTI